MNSHRCPTLLAGLLLVAGCADSGPAAMDEARTLSLVQTPWQLAGITGLKLDVGTPAVTLSIADGQVSGFAGCNRYFASVETGDGSIDIGMIGSTRMACETSAMDLESAFLRALEVVSEYRIADGSLVMSGETAEGAITELTFVEGED